jgi:hypothetical protein
MLTSSFISVRYPVWVDSSYGWVTWVHLWGPCFFYWRILAKSLPFKGAGYFQAWKNFSLFLKICQISPFGLTWFARKPIKNKHMSFSYGPCIWYECARCLLLSIRVYHFRPWSRGRRLFILSFLLLLSSNQECALRGVGFNVNDLFLWFAKAPYTLEHPSPVILWCNFNYQSFSQQWKSICLEWCNN